MEPNRHGDGIRTGSVGQSIRGRPFLETATESMTDASDENLYANRWDQIIHMRPEFVQIISWNDGGER